MYRFVVVALLLALVVMRAAGQSAAEPPRSDVQEQREESYIAETMLDVIDSSSQSIPENATALRATRRNHEQLADDYMRLARSFDNNGNLTAARDALEKMHGELAYLDDPRSTAGYHMQLGLLDYSEDQFDEAVRNLLSALTFYQQLEDTVLM